MTRILGYAAHNEAVSQERRPRVLLADDYPGLLAALRRMLDRSCDVVGSVSSGRDAVAAATALKPDVIVLDLTLPDVSGLDACRQIKVAAPATKVVLLTAVDDMDVRASALQAGASAFVVKHATTSELVGTIHSLFAETYRSS
jgi:DNA-binding NarL/FixJ family response regulator